MTRPMVIKWLKWIQNMFPEDSEQYKALTFAIDSLEVDEAYQLEYEKIDRKPMTNAEKFKEIFGYNPATDSLVCNAEDWCGQTEPCSYCLCNSDRIGREEDWWNAQYKEAADDNQGNA